MLAADEFEILRCQRAFLNSFVERPLSDLWLLSLMFDAFRNGLAVAPWGRDDCMWIMSPPMCSSLEA